RFGGSTGSYAFQSIDLTLCARPTVELVACSFMVGGVAQHFLGAGTDFHSKGGDARVRGHPQAGPLAQRLYDPAAFAGEFILVVADLDESPGVLFTMFEGVRTLVVQHVPAELLIHPGNVLRRLDLGRTGRYAVVDLLRE